MSDMVEQVACAIGTALCGHAVVPASIWDAGPSSLRGTPVWKYYEPAARAAIRAMREPTADMIKAGSVRWHKGDYQMPSAPYLSDSGALVWERAIDEALK